MTITVCQTQAQVDAIAAPKHVWRDGVRWVVSTGAGIPAVTIPTVVTMRQARLALLQMGLLTTVNNAILAMAAPYGDAARIEWEFSSEVHRDKALVKTMATSLALTTAQLDALFTLAGGL